MAADRARTLLGDVGVAVRGYRKHAAPATVRCAVRGLAEACVPDPDQLMLRLLDDVIVACEPWRTTANNPRVAPEMWVDACQLTGGN